MHSPIETTTKKSGLSQRYTFVSSEDIIDEMKLAGFYLSAYQVVRSRSPENIPYAKHLMRFQHITTPDTLGETPEIIIINSHNGSSAIRVMLGIYRFVCSNGLFAGNTYGHIRISHSSSDAIHQASLAALELMDSFGDILKAIDLWKSIQLTQKEASNLASCALLLIKNETIREKLFYTDLLKVRRSEDYGNDLWTIFNIIQENLVTGGQRYSSRNGRMQTRRRTKDLKALEQMNKGLWNLTEDLANFKKGSK